MEDKKSKGKRIILMAVVILALAAVGIYFSWPRVGAGNDTPPSLSIGSGSFGGFSVDDVLNFYTYDGEDVAAWEAEGRSSLLSTSWGDPKTLERGVHFYSTDTKRTINDIIGLIKPIEGNRLLVAFYTPGEEDDLGDLPGGFYTYPKGRFTSGGSVDVFEIENPDTFEIPAHRPFIIINVTDTEIWGLVTEKEIGSTFKALDNNESGWILLQMPENLENAIAPIQDRIDSTEDGTSHLWVQDDVNHFYQVGDLSAIPTGDFKMIWIRMKEKMSVS